MQTKRAEVESKPRQANPSIDGVSGNHLRRLHRAVIDSPRDVHSLLDRAREDSVTLFNGVDRKSAPRTATIIWVGQDRLRLSSENLRASGQPQIYFHFDLAGCRYFFAVPPISGGNRDLLDVEVPEAIYEAERRDLHRVRVAGTPLAGDVRLTSTIEGKRKSTVGTLHDVSYQGIGVVLAAGDADSLSREVDVEFLAGDRSGQRIFGRVHSRRGCSNDDAKLVGLSVSALRPTPPFPVERRDRILDGGIARRAWRTFSFASELAKSRKRQASRADIQSEQDRIEVVSYRNERGQEIRGILDRACGGKGGTAVVIPPAWGRTKETFLALAQAVVATYESIGQPVTVLRFDGTNRRGESFVDPECRAPGDEYLHFSFSQAVRDIEASFEFLENRPDIAPKNFVLVSFSLGSVEGRRTVVRDGGRRLAGWISVVGMVDLQSGLRTVSGGVDYIYGISRGVSFGRHEMVGVVADMDRAGRDGFDQKLMFLEDVKTDMAKIDVPITWLHGRDDAWMELDRVQSALAAGRRDNRRLLEIPTGHQMRSSREALETFQLVATETVRMSMGIETEPAIPDLANLRLRTRAEQTRRPPPTINAPSFWEDYLLGRDRSLGFELMSGTSAYRELMSKQIDMLNLADGDVVVDLGAGNGDFPLQLAQSTSDQSIRVIEVDLVPGALSRGRDRLQDVEPRRALEVDRVAANLELNGYSIPLAAESANVVLASLFLSYVEKPEKILRAIFHLLAPGGRFVISSMKRDADVSRIYVDSISELPPDRRRAHFGLESDEFEEIQRVFLNDAARLLHLEEIGRFQFWDADELRSMCESVGFLVNEEASGFGNPPQAVILSGVRPPAPGK